MKSITHVNFQFSLTDVELLLLQCSVVIDVFEFKKRKLKSLKAYWIPVNLLKQQYYFTLSTSAMMMGLANNSR